MAVHFNACEECELTNIPENIKECPKCGNKELRLYSHHRGKATWCKIEIKG